MGEEGKGPGEGGDEDKRTCVWVQAGAVRGRYRNGEPGRRQSPGACGEAASGPQHAHTHVHSHVHAHFRGVGHHGTECSARHCWVAMGGHPCRCWPSLPSPDLVSDKLALPYPGLAPPPLVHLGTWRGHSICSWGPRPCGRGRPPAPPLPPPPLRGSCSLSSRTGSAALPAQHMTTQHSTAQVRSGQWRCKQAANLNETGTLTFSECPLSPCVVVGGTTHSHCKPSFEAGGLGVGAESRALDPACSCTGHGHGRPEQARRAAAP